MSTGHNNPYVPAFAVTIAAFVLAYLLSLAFS